MEAAVNLNSNNIVTIMLHYSVSSVSGDSSAFSTTSSTVAHLKNCYFVEEFALLSFNRSLCNFLGSAGQPAVKVDNEFKVMRVVVHPSSPEVFLCGGYSSTVKAWDSRSCKVTFITLLTADLSF